MFDLCCVAASAAGLRELSTGEAMRFGCVATQLELSSAKEHRVAAQLELSSAKEHRVATQLELSSN